MQLFCDGAPIGLLLLRHNDKILSIEQNAEVAFGDELSGPSPYIHSVLSLPVRISIWPDDQLRRSINKAFLPFVTVLDLGPVRNASPTGYALGITWFGIAHR